MGKTELAMTPLQQWGEEVEDGAIYSIILERVKAEAVANRPCHLQEDSGLPECPFVQYRTCKRRVLRAATLPRLVKWLVAAKAEGDLDYIPSFLATYQAFATSAQVLELLLALGPNKDAACAEWSYTPSETQVRSLGVLLDSSLNLDAQALGSGQDCRAVLQVLELWLQHHPEDFWEPPEHHNLQKVLHFLHQSAPDSPACALAGRLLQGDKQKEEEEEEEEEERRNAASAAANAVRNWKACPHDMCIQDICLGLLLPMSKRRKGKFSGESLGMGMTQATREAAEAGECKEMPVLLSFSLDEVAEQLTLMDADLFKAVRPFHCTGCVWSHRDKKENQHMAPTVRATVAQFNAVTSCVITSVLGDLTLRTPQRAHLLEKWISIAQHCRALRNFSSLHAILSALQSNSIYRLKRTWAAVNRESRSTFRKLSQIFSEDNNYLNCREILMQKCLVCLIKPGWETSVRLVFNFQKPRRAWLVEGGTESSCDGQSSPQMPAGSSLLLRPQTRPVAPTIPYLGTFLTDLIMLDTALPDFLEGNLINFEKRRKEAAILSCIRHLQESCQRYNLSLNPSFHDAFHQHQQLSEEQSYRISRVIEPTADSCPNSPKLHRSLTKRFSSLLLGSDSSGAPSGPDRSGISPLGSCNSLNSEDGSNAPCSPTWGSPTVKNFPVSQPRASSPLELPPASPISKQRGTESRIVRVSMDNKHDNGNLYRSIVITSQDKTTAVVKRALQKHNLEGDSPCNYRFLQLLGDGQELLIPEGANAFYAMNPTGPHDFLLSLKEEATISRSLGTTQLGGKTTPHSPLTFKDFGTRTPAATLYPTLSGNSPHSAPPSPLHLGPPSPASSSWFPGVQSPNYLPESPPFSLSLPLPQHSSPAPPETVLPSPLQSSQISSSVSQGNPGYSLGASPNPCAAHPFSAP